MTEIGSRTKKVRRVLGLTQLKFADSLSIDRSHVSKIESGKAEPSNKLVELICKTFEVNKIWLLDGKGPMSWNEDFTLKELEQFKSDPKSKLNTVNAGSLLLNIIESLNFTIGVHSNKLYEIFLLKKDELGFKKDLNYPMILSSKEALKSEVGYLLHVLDGLFKSIENE